MEIKLSEAMELGFAKVGRQCKGKNFEGGTPFAPKAVCAIGAANFRATGDAQQHVTPWDDARRAYRDHYLSTISDDNDRGMEISEIVKRLRAIHE